MHCHDQFPRRDQAKPTCESLVSRISRSNGFVMYSSAPASIAARICAMSFSVVQKTIFGRRPSGSAEMARRKSMPLITRSEEHTSELQSLMRISYAVFCLKKKKKDTTQHTDRSIIPKYDKYRQKSTQKKLIIKT